ncbi:semaphorin-4G isoform X2 [Brienomyrus brachyistius]|uniref:semaphorin-4G isoform X2 n=1 Tax=Brienomyrus brachyistius TaxID=42636 RepID=UPI0020B39360|nr:semaphorin-4G isoform X2 [Brienomyrus brachyistius]
MWLHLTFLWMYFYAPRLWGLPFKSDLELDVTPRITVPFSGLLGCRRFGSSLVRNYSTLLLEEREATLYVAAREVLYALDARNISAPAGNQSIRWEASAGQKQQCMNKGRDNQTECFNYIRFLQRFNETHLYACGTNAFRPLCVYIDSERFTFTSRFEEGREKCPYDPAKGYTGLFVDGEMYTATQYDFRSSPDIRRNFPNPMVKTEEGPNRWLLEADFVGSAMLRESINSSIGDDDKIYFFFTEKSQEQTAYYSQTRVARVARVCKGDWGGQRTLQKKWTSFLKARLLCSIPDYEFHLNVLRDVFVMEAPGQASQDSIFYGIFGLEWKNGKTSAVCRYSIKEVQNAFDGPYMENEDSKWTEYRGNVPEPRPGSCITDAFRAKGINSSRDLPDEVLNFVRRHPLVSQHIRPMENRPLLVKRRVSYTQIAVLRVAALDSQQYDLLFIGTDDGWLHRAVEVKGQVHITEELQLFQKPQPVERIVISQAQRSVYVGSPSAVLQLPLSTCGRYSSCYDCVFARDPLCAWNGAACVGVQSRADSLVQDVAEGNRGCGNPKENDSTIRRTRSVTSGDDVLLQCELRSNLATPQWTLDGRELQGYGLDSGYRVGTDGLLLIGARPEQSGRYVCLAAENGLRIPMATYAVWIRPGPGEPTSRPLLPDLPTEQPLPSPPPPLPQTFRNMETLYISLVAILGGLCLVLTTVLLYVSFCAVAGPHRSKRLHHQQGGAERKRSSHLELKTISSRCNGKWEEAEDSGAEDSTGGGFLQIVPGEGQLSPGKEPPLPEAPPLPAPPPLPASEYANGLSATLPSVLRKMNGNSYVLLRQADPESTSPLYHSFTEELNRILEKRKHTQLVTSQPDESSV